MRVMKKIDALIEKLKINEKKAEIEGLLLESSQPNFWRDSQLAGKKMQQLADLQAEVDEVEKLKQMQLSGQETELNQLLKKLELKTFLGGQYDRGDAILSLHSGQGGVEAMDWTEMLLRMYLRFIEKKGWQGNLVEEIRGEEAGIKTATVFVSGSYAYGHLKHEVGTHRLVRQSPFNADKLRQTSFALVQVLPLIEEKEIEVKEDDLDWQFFRASTQGGQNVQKVSSAVRLTHKPTGIIVTSQSERFQTQNRQFALQLLKAKLWEQEEKKKKETEAQLRGKAKQASWGTQIRSYVLHPYHLVKDLRTGCESNNTVAVLGGDLDGFIQEAIYKLS